MQRPLPPCVLHEDEHLLVVNKPPGLNTHAPGPFAGEGIYDWLRNREPRWVGLGIMQRLDRETSGVLVFTKSPLANQSLSHQFEAHSVTKKYHLVTDHQPNFTERTIETGLRRQGERYVACPQGCGDDQAITRFRVLESTEGRTLLEAEPVTGKTHQIRVHAASSGFPILGDTLYGGTVAARLHLHSTELKLVHPETKAQATFRVEANFNELPWQAIRSAIILPEETDACRLLHGAGDGWPGWRVDRLGGCLLSQSADVLAPAQIEWLRRLLEPGNTFSGAYHKVLTKKVRQLRAEDAAPTLALGNPAPDEFAIRENGVRFAIRLAQGYSVGLFLDQRDNRRRLLTKHVAPGFELPPETGWTLLNTFAYTCGFSVCAALAGAKTTSLDLSRNYLEWGQRNFVLNGLRPENHNFIYGDAFDWAARLRKKGRSYDLVILDPPTFSQSKLRGNFQAEKNYAGLVKTMLPLVKSGGVLFASTNAAKLEPEDFVAQVKAEIKSAGRKILAHHYAPQPPDFPIRREEPAHLKTLWLRLS